MTKLLPKESVLTGRWLVRDGHSVADEVAQRIADLTRSHLVLVAKDESGWNTLYRDPDDGRLWELVYPQSELHGGGPPELRQLSAEAANNKYGVR